MSFTENFLKELEKKKKIIDNTEVESPYSDGTPFLDTTGYTGNFLHALDYYKKVQNGEITTAQEDEPTKNEKRTWVQGGAFSNGYQFGDITKTVLGTVGDAVSDIGGGVLEMVEGAIDSLMYLGALKNTVTGSKNPIEHLNERYGYNFTYEDPYVSFIKRDLFDGSKVMDAINPLNYASTLIGGDMEEDSLLGDRTDSLLQSGGQLLGTAALQAAGVPWWITTGVPSFGKSAEGALNEGASVQEAGISALISTGADILTEQISGGIKFGGKTLDAGLTSALSRKISDKFVRKLAKLGIDAFGEGMEEVIAENISSFGEWMTYRNDEELAEVLWSEEAMDAKIEAFIGGAVLGGGSNVVNANKSNKKGVDPVSGLTANEEAVVKKIYDDRVAEAAKNGKVTETAKNKIYDDVIKALEKGDISTDVIEEVLGGDTYKSYQDTVKNEDALQKEYDELADIKKSELTVKQEKRLNELEAKLEELKTTSERDFLQKKYKSEVYEIAKGSKLEESYNERARRGQAFTADLTKYNDKQRTIVQKAIDSGILNNTNKTHDFVDLVARIAGDKGVDFDFLNNAKLKESGFALDGVTVNGYFDAKTKSVGINLNSAKALNTVVGHEITHVLEGTELYGELQKAVTEYAKTKGEYQSRYDALAELYKNIEGADIDAELTADLVGDYLFTDADFVNNLSTKHRNVFQKIYDEIKYLCKVATAGTKEARQLEKVKKTFEDAFRAETKNTAQEGGVKYSITEPFVDSNGNSYDNAVLLDTDFFDGISPRNWGDKLQEEVNRRANEDPFILPIVDENGSTTILQFAGAEERVTKDGKSNHAVNDKLSFTSDNISKLAVVHIDEVVSVSEENNPYYTNENNHQWLDKNGWLHRNANVINSQNGNIYNLTVDIAKTADGRTILYATNGKIKKVGNVQVDSLKIKGPGQNSNLNNSIPQNSGKSTQNTKKSLSVQDEDLGPIGDYNVYGKEVALKEAYPDDYAPIGETSNSQTSVDSENGDVNRVDTEGATTLSTESSTENGVLDNITDDEPIQTVKDKLEARLGNLNTELYNVREKQAERVESLDERIADLQTQYDAKANKDTKVANKLLRNIERLKRIRADIVADYRKRISDIESRIERVNGELQKDHSKADRLEKVYARIDRQLEQDKVELQAEYESKKAEAQKTLADKNSFIKNRANELYWELSNLKKGVRASKDLGYLLDHNYDWSELKTALVNVKMHPDSTVRQDSAIESIVREALNKEYESRSYELDEIDAQYESDVAKLEAEADKERAAARKAEDTIRRSELHGKIVEDVKNKFAESGYDFDVVLKHAKDLSTFSTVDNTPQRVMEKSLGYKEGGILADLTVNKVAQNETEGIKWLNSITDRKKGLLAQLVKDYGIKPGSKESAASQMYAEGFYVDKNGNIIQYGDVELKADFPDSKVRENIKALSKDQRIRQFYDETLDAINESRIRNGYPEIQKLDNYFLHFRAMEDTFSRLGLPFNPNDIRAKDLPTDLNGVTADLKPGQPYFASSKHREGKRTSFDLLGGLEKYATSAKNQIYHIDDIQTLRALRNYIADTYGQAKGLENLDTLTEEEVQEKIKEVYGSHLSTFAKFLNEEANMLAGKTALIDRGLEGVIGRRAMTFMDTVNRQVGSNMVGYNVSSALTNLIAPVQAFAKTNKADFIRGFAQTVSNRIKSINGKGDTFTEESPVCVRRKGTDRFHRTAWQKLSDPGYALMGAVDNFSTEIIARAKYNEFTRKGMDSETAHVETDKWVSRLMGDRSLGQMPQLYNSKMLGLVTKFQLEVRNQLDSQFYDTIQEAKASTVDIENALERNAKKAAKIGSTFFSLAVGQHLFGKAFEAVAGYNPAFDIISVLIKALGFDDDEDSEDTVLDNLEQGFFELMGDMPYTSILEGGRIPISSALPIEELYKGTDQYGNDKSRWETVLEALPYYALPGGYGQFKKTKQGLSMFNDDLPVSGSYTDSGKLRFPVDDNLWKRVQAGLFGQYASGNARDYFDNDRKALDEKQIQEFVDSGIFIQDYWEYREGLSGLKTLNEKADYVYSLDIPIEAKNLFINNLSGRKEEIDLSGMEGFESFEEYDYAQSNPGKYAVSKAVAGDLAEYKQYSKELGAIESDKDKDGKTVSGSRKKNVVNYINGLDLDYGQKIILFRSQYKTDNTYNHEIVDYLNSREDISRETMVAILEELGFKVDGNSVTWD